MNTTTNIDNTFITVNWDAVNWNDSTMISGGSSINYGIGIDDLLDIEWEEDLKLTQEWKEMNDAAKSNPALQKAIEHARILFYLNR